MTEAVKLNEGTGGASIVVDELTTLNGQPVPSETTPPTGPIVQRMKVGFGSDGSLRDVDAENPLPVSGPLTAVQLRAAAVPVSLAAEVEVKNDAGNPLAVSVASLPLPTDAATAPYQAATNNLLALIDSDIGATTAAAAPDAGTGDYSLIAGIKRALLNWANLLGRIPAALGQTTMAASWPVAIASNQSAIPVTLPNMQASTYNQTGPIGINTDLLVIDCSGLEGLSIQCISMGAAGVVTAAWSDDGINYPANAVLVTPAGAPANTFNAAGLWTTPVLARHLRLRLTTATTSGTTTLVVQGITQAANFPVAAQPVTLSSQSVGLSAGSNTIGNVTSTRQSGFTDSSTPLGAGAAFTGTGRALAGGSPWWSKFCATAWADQAGTLFIDLSTDSGANYRPIASQPVTAGAGATLSVPVTGVAGAATLYRARFVNGGVAQGAFQISSSYTAA